MAITGAVAAAIRKEDPYADWIGMGARAIIDPGGFRTGGRPYYWLMGAAYRRFKDIPGALVTANSQRLSLFGDGSYRAIAANEPREVPFKGFESEEVILNYNRNNQMAGAVIGGASPTFWTQAGTLNGITRSIVGLGTEFGLAYLDMRLQGTPSANGSAGYNFDAASACAAVQNEVFNASFFARFLTTTGALNIASGVVEHAGGTPLTYTGGGTSAPSTAFQRFVQSRTIADPTTTNLMNYFLVGYTSGVPIDATVRIYHNQLTKTAFACSPIPTGGAAATKSADLISITNVAPLFVGLFTSFWEAELLSVDGVSRSLAEANDGTNQNRAFTYRAADNSAGSFVASAGVGSSSGVSGKTGARILKIANRNRSADQQAWIDGVAGPSLAQTPPVAMNRLDIGCRSYAGQQLNGFVRRGAIFGDLADVYPLRLTA